MRVLINLILFFSIAVFSNAAVSPVSFTSNPVPVTGTNGFDGYIFRFNGVGTGIDAIVTNVSIDNASNQLLSGGITTNALGGTTTDNFVIDLSNDQNSGIDPETGLATLATGTTSTRMRIDFVNAGAIINSAADIPANLATAADYIFTFYDIDTVFNRRRLDTITAFDTIGYYTESNTLLDVTVAPDFSSVTAQLAAPSQVSVAPGDASYSRHAISFEWDNVQHLEFEWSFPYTQKGTRGVEIDGVFPPGVPYNNIEYSPVPEPSTSVGVSCFLILIGFRFFRRPRRSS